MRARRAPFWLVSPAAGQLSDGPWRRMNAGPGFVNVRRAHDPLRTREPLDDRCQVVDLAGQERGDAQPLTQRDELLDDAVD